MEPSLAAAAAAARALLLLLLGSVLFQTYAVDLEIKDEYNITCLYAEWSMNISIKYETEANDYKSISFMLPTEARYDGSTCGNSTYGPVLAMEFGEEHSWVITFTKTEDTFQGSISFTYNTNDTHLFPDAKRQGPITITVNYPVEPVKLYTVYSCHNRESVESDDVTQEIWNVTLQAYLEEGFLSSEKTVCSRDTAVITTSVPTSSTTPVTTTTTTTAVPLPPLPTLQPIEIPGVGSYSLHNNNSEVCLLATMGLQLNISQKVPLIFNFNPNTTVANGSCGSAVSVLKLTDGRCSVEFVFAVKNTSMERFSLREANISIIESKDVTLSGANRSLDYWDTSLGSSYMCQKEETLMVTPGYKMNIFDLKIQPFEVQDDQFAVAQECLLDDDTVLIPIVVGAALAGLIVIIVIAYIIGRRKSYAGYQTL